VARDGHSLHLTFTLTEPTPDDLVEALEHHFAANDHDLMHRHHTLSLEAKSTAVHDALLAKIAMLDEDEWIQLALTRMREKTG
jgi:hypothetical protein